MLHSLMREASRSASKGGHQRPAGRKGGEKMRKGATGLPKATGTTPREGIGPELPGRDPDGDWLQP